MLKTMAAWPTMNSQGHRDDLKHRFKNCQFSVNLAWFGGMYLHVTLRLVARHSEKYDSPADNLYMLSTLTLNFTSTKNNKRLGPGLLLLGLTALLTACGGGSDSTPTIQEAAPLPTAATVSSPAAAATSSAPTASGDSSCGLNSPAGIQAEALQRVNAFRASGAVCGGVAYPAAGALNWNVNLLQAAKGHASDMATNNYFSHIGQDGRSPDQRVLAAGYSYTRMGENIAAGQTSVESAMAAWIASASHCQNMMTRDFRDIAVACVRNDASAYRFYWVMEMGRPL